MPIDFRTFGQREIIVSKQGRVPGAMPGSFMLGMIHTKETILSGELTDDEAALLTSECDVKWTPCDQKKTGSKMKYRCIYMGKRYYANFAPGAKKVEESVDSTTTTNAVDSDKPIYATPATCQGTTAAGNPCKRSAVSGSNYCKSHLPRSKDI